MIAVIALLVSKRNDGTPPLGKQQGIALYLQFPISTKGAQ
jgi:hypothetical protein